MILWLSVVLFGLCFGGFLCRSGLSLLSSGLSISSRISSAADIAAASGHHGSTYSDSRQIRNHFFHNKPTSSLKERHERKMLSAHNRQKALQKNPYPHGTGSVFTVRSIPRDLKPQKARLLYQRSGRFPDSGIITVLRLPGIATSDIHAETLPHHSDEIVQYLQLFPFYPCHGARPHRAPDAFEYLIVCNVTLTL